MAEDNEGFWRLVHRFFGVQTMTPEELRRRVNEVRYFPSAFNAAVLHFCVGVYGSPHWTRRLIIEFGADVNMVERHGHTPLVRAIKCRIEDSSEAHVRVLLECGASINTSINPHFSPLGIACALRYPTIVSLLLDHGANYGHLEHEYYTEEIQQLIRNARACDDRARAACGAIWTALYRHQRLPRDLVQMLMHRVWQEKRNKVWLELFYSLAYTRLNTWSVILMIVSSSSCCTTW